MQDEEAVLTCWLSSREGCLGAPDMMDKYIVSPAPRDASLAAECCTLSARATDLDDRDDI